MIFFTADTHFGHYNIIKYCKRPFKTIDDMNNTIINNWNKVVNNKDLVYHLGDFSLRQNKKNEINDILNALNGQIFLIKGNHDQTKQLSKKIKQRFIAIKDIHTVKIQDDEINTNQKHHIMLCHYPIRNWDGQFHDSWHLYGHSHGMLEEDQEKMSFDVGVDCNNFYPFSYEDVKLRMLKKIKVNK